MWTQRVHNLLEKLHEHIDLRTVDNWSTTTIRSESSAAKDPNAAKLAMAHLENTKQMLFNETSDDFEFNADRYLFAENPVVHLDTAVNGAKRPYPSGALRACLTVRLVSKSVSACVNPLAPSPQSAKSTSNTCSLTESQVICYN